MDGHDQPDASVSTSSNLVKMILARINAHVHKFSCPTVFTSSLPQNALWVCRRMRQRGYSKIRYLLSGLLALCLLTVVGIPAIYVAQAQGVCLRKGRILDDNEIRQSVLVNFIDYMINEAITRSVNRGDDSQKIGIAQGQSSINIFRDFSRQFLNRKFIGEEVHYVTKNTKSIEEDLNITLLYGFDKKQRHTGAFVIKQYNINELKEPFVLIDYNSERSRAYISTEIDKADLAEIERKTGLKRIYEPSIRDVLLGYGRYFFKISSSIPYFSVTNTEMFIKEDKILSDVYRRLASLTYPSAAMISNCGDIYTFPLYDTKPSPQLIKEVSFQPATRRKGD